MLCWGNDIHFSWPWLLMLRERHIFLVATSLMHKQTYVTNEKWMSFPQHSISRPRHKDVVSLTKLSCGHDIISRSHKLIWCFHKLISRGYDILSRSQDLIYRGHDKTKWTEDVPSQAPYSSMFLPYSHLVLHVLISLAWTQSQFVLFSVMFRGV